MRTNINNLFKRGYGVQELVSWLANYFDDQRQAKDKWPWTFFVRDPIRWSGPTQKKRAYLEGFEDEEG